MLLQQIAKWCAADVIVYVGCGEREDELAEVVAELFELADPRTGGRITDRTVRELRGPLVVLDGVSGTGWDEFVRIGLGSGEERQGLVLEVDRDLAVVEVPQGTPGCPPPAPRSSSPVDRCTSRSGRHGWGGSATGGASRSTVVLRHLLRDRIVPDGGVRTDGPDSVVATVMTPSSTGGRARRRRSRPRHAMQDPGRADRRHRHGVVLGAGRRP